uniref:Centrosomal protein 89 n=1 Tax=Sarcophilus harrisii TaxID=9305 RepID=A0A7N4NMH7_SARHA
MYFQLIFAISNASMLQRSALAAAILVSTLTGRTFAIPQPKYRSHSESDATYLEEDGGIIEPYATITEIRPGPEWPDGEEKKYSLPAFKMSSYSEDEDEEVETYLSDNYRDIELSTQKKENNFENAVYAVPNRNNKVFFEYHRISIFWKQFCTLKLPNLLFQFFPSFPPPPSPDGRRRREQMELSKRNFDELKQQNFYLTTTNETLAHELEKIKQEMKELHSQCKEMDENNETVKETKQSPQKKADMGEFLSLRQEAQELVDENDHLKMTIYRLNVELSRYQTKFRHLSKEENIEIKGLPFKGSPPPWLVDIKYLSPLILAYEDRMKEKDDLNVMLEEEMKMFKKRIEEVIKENETLHQELNKTSPLTSKEWHQLQTQAQLVLEENKVLMQQLEIQQAKAKENNQQHSQEVSKVIKQQMLLENKVKSQEKALAENEQQMDILRSKYQNLKIQVDSQMEIKVHDTIVNELKSQLQKEKEKWNAETDNLIGKMTELQTQNKSLLLDKIKLEAENKALRAELERAQKLNRGSQKQIDLLQQQVEESIEKEELTHQYLTNFVIFTNAIAQERDNLIQLTQCLESEKQGVLYKIKEKNIRLGKLEEKVKMYKKKAAVKLGDFNHKMTKQEEDFAEKIYQYEREMKHLQQLLQDKQDALEEVLQQKREVEGELEVVWQSTAKENQRMKEFLHTTFGKTHSWKKASIYESGLNQISKEDLVEGYAVSYCEVKSSSGIQLPEMPALHNLYQTEPSENKDTTAKSELFLQQEANLC